MSARKMVCRLIGHNFKFTRITLPRVMVCTTCGKKVKG